MRRGVTRVALMGVLLALGSAWSMAGACTAQAAEATSIVLNRPTITDASIELSGVIQTSPGVGVPSIAVSVYFNDSRIGAATSDTNGSFFYSIPRPAEGNYSIRVVFGGSADYGTSSAQTTVRVPAVTKAPTQITVKIEPASTEINNTVVITGTLTANGRGVGQAVVSLSADYGQIDSSAPTNAEGKFSVTMYLPSTTPIPGKFTVTAQFIGDSLYEASQTTAQGTLVSPTPTPTPSASSTRPARPTTAPTGDETWEPIIDDEPVVRPPQSRDAEMAVIQVSFLVVAIIGLASLLALGIISHDRRKLIRGERRGFGTDFGSADDE